VNSRLTDESGEAKLHLETYTAAFRVLALARCLWSLLFVSTFGAAMFLADSGLTIAARMFALLRVRHKRSYLPNMPSAF